VSGSSIRIKVLNRDALDLITRTENVLNENEPIELCLCFPLHGCRYPFVRYKQVSIGYYEPSSQSCRAYYHI